MYPMYLNLDLLYNIWDFLHPIDVFIGGAIPYSPLFVFFCRKRSTVICFEEHYFRPEVKIKLEKNKMMYGNEILYKLKLDKNIGNRYSRVFDDLEETNIST